MVEALGMVTMNLQKRCQQIGVSVYKIGISTESVIAWNRKNFFETLLRPEASGSSLHYRARSSGCCGVVFRGLGVNWVESSVPLPCHFIIVTNTLR